MHITTTKNREVIDITALVTAGLNGSGLVNIFVQHTTAAVIIADMDPGTDHDYLAMIEKLTPDRQWVHPHDPAHFPDHFWSATLGVSLTLPYIDGKLMLGSWQRIILVELQGPREREIMVTCLGAPTS
jgi:secondary thiamine-phosphate synthase enzyme